MSDLSVQTTPREFTVNIHSVKADWNDENQRVKVRVEIGLRAFVYVARLPRAPFPPMPQHQT
jgi:hypothetical protein